MADFAVNLGGQGTGGSYNTTVNVFQSTGTSVARGPAAYPLTGRYNLAAASCNNYFLAMGGNSGANTPIDSVSVYKFKEGGGSYNIVSIVDPTPGADTPALKEARYSLAAAALGNYILALGGMESHGYPLDAVDVFLTRTDVDLVENVDASLSLSVGRSNLAAASSGDYLLAMGGLERVPGQSSQNAPSNVIDVFHLTSNGVELFADHDLSLSEARTDLAAASCGEYILAMGGRSANGISDVVDVFRVTSSSVVRVSTELQLSEPRRSLAATTCGEYIFAIGGYAPGGYSNVVDVFKVTTNGIEKVNIPLILNVPRDSLTAASCGNFVLAMGGNARSGYSNAIDVFEVKQN